MRLAEILEAIKGFPCGLADGPSCEPCIRGLEAGPLCVADFAW